MSQVQFEEGYEDEESLSMCWIPNWEKYEGISQL